MRDPSAHLELRFQPTVDLISTTRKFVCAYYTPLLDDADVVSRIGLATHELLENILKYSADGETTARVSLVMDGKARTVTVQTTNRISEEKRAGLEQIFADMERAADAFAFYQLTMGKARHRTEGSGLGLARVWAEGEMTITHEFAGEFVTITAVATLPPEEKS